jgi:hypothetical protein
MVLDGAVWEPSKSERVSEPSHQGGGAMTVHGKVEHFIPEGVAQNPAFTNVVAVSGPLAEPDYHVELEAMAVVPK